MSPLGEMVGPISSPSSAPSASDPLLISTTEDGAPAIQSTSPSAPNGESIDMDEKKCEDEDQPCSTVDKVGFL